MKAPTPAQPRAPLHSRAPTALPTAPHDYRAAARTDVLRVTGLPPASIGWINDSPVGNALVAHLPWARVVLARSPQQAQRFATDYEAKHAPRCTWFYAALLAHYPHAPRAAWADATLVVQDSYVAPEPLRAFVAWALKGKGAGQRRSKRTINPVPLWPVAPGVVVQGAWGTWHDAVLLHQPASNVYLLRTAAWADWTAPFVAP